jgi:hypothetical protein
LDILPISLHQRTPFFVGSRKMVEKAGGWFSWINHFRILFLEMNLQSIIPEKGWDGSRYFNKQRNLKQKWADKSFESPVAWSLFKRLFRLIIQLLPLCPNH